MAIENWWNSLPGSLASRLQHALKYYRPEWELSDVLDLLGRELPLKPSRYNDGIYGCYAIDTPDLSFQFRVTPTTPGSTGPLPFPNVVICRCDRIAQQTSA